VRVESGENFSDLATRFGSQRGGYWTPPDGMVGSQEWEERWTTNVKVLRQAYSNLNLTTLPLSGQQMGRVAGMPRQRPEVETD